jgi:hypothetical protein
VSALTSDLRGVLEAACVRGRRASEVACRAALSSLGVPDKAPPSYLDEGQRSLRRGLRAKARQLGDADDSIDLLVTECAYEQWHRLLFASFLEANELLIHPEFRAPVTLAECEELANDLGEPDGWAVASRFAAAILPGIFQLGDPCVQLKLAPEGRLELEKIVAGLPVEILTADDALGWVYQYWQKEKKKEVNTSERKVGGSDLGPATQLFTENYMVRFLLENSLGAWWAARYPDSPLVHEWHYLRLDDRLPAAGSFDRWPDCVAEVTLMDPCCGSGHFLVDAFSMLWRMRAEEEHLSPLAAQDAVLRDNLFGLELDPRCVQIAMFAVALAAWKAGGGWRALPTPSIACSGIPVKAPVDAWRTLAGGDPVLENALVRLHILFRDADTLGSLIDPKRAVEITDPTGLQSSFEDVDWEDVAPLLTSAFVRETIDPASAVLGADVVTIAKAADLLSRTYSLVITNPPYLARSKQSEILRDFATGPYVAANADLATTFLIRFGTLVAAGGTDATVTPQNWLFLKTYADLRRHLLRGRAWNVVGRLGSGATATKSWDTLRALVIQTNSDPVPQHSFVAIDSTTSHDDTRAIELRDNMLIHLNQLRQLSNPDARVVFVDLGDAPLLETVADALQGISPADTARFRRQFWEVRTDGDWVRWQRPAADQILYGGRDSVLQWNKALFDAAARGEAAIRGESAWGRTGVAVRQVGRLPATLYTGDRFDTSCAVIVPHDPHLLPALWAFVTSSEFPEMVRELDRKLNVTNATFGKVPFDHSRWAKVAETEYPDGLPDPSSNDPTQWLFDGRPEAATEPLQVAVGRLVGYRWPDQPDSDDLDALADADGIVCLPSVLGESPAATRLQELLGKALGETWSPVRTAGLLAASGSAKKDLESWLRDDFFRMHCQAFKHRPFIWHIWDGLRDGFAALVNYHRLDRPSLERLTYTYLGDWIERQAAGARDDAAGAEERLSAAQDLQRRLQLILDGESPYDIYVRWKTLAEQPIGWDPDIDDGVRINVRPFVEAEVLRSKFNVKWEKDRGKNSDGSERHNDLHAARADKEAARRSLAK